MSAVTIRLTVPLGVLILMTVTAILPTSGHCEFGSPFDLDEPTSAQADQLLTRYHICGALILYSAVAGEHPEWLVANLETAGLMADALADDHESYELLVEAFRVIALHLNEHRDDSELRAVENGQSFCNNLELCGNEAASSPACTSVRSTVETLDY